MKTQFKNSSIEAPIPHAIESRLSRTLAWRTARQRLYVIAFFCWPCLMAQVQSQESKKETTSQNRIGQKIVEASTVKTADEVAKTIAFLKSLRQLLDQPQMTANSVSVAFAWQVERQLHAPDGSYTHTDFSLYSEKKWADPSHTEHRKRGAQSLRIPLVREHLCLSSGEVLGEFGSAFKRNFAVSAHPYPDVSSLSETVKNNRKLFDFGPIYEFSDTAKTTNLYFNFSFSECVEYVSITQTLQSGAKK